MIPAAEITIPVTTEVVSIKAFMRQCAEEGIDLASPLGESALRIWLESPTAAVCRCKSRLRTWERLNGKCERCADYERRRMDDALVNRPTFAR